ncbi:phosphotransferase family protein [Brachybacterium nesterenkovii]|uniref:phosphotransferase family protein n=1 Tax=Brachybacterium nesterenkovii TaxID=47847 RepID=UPI000B357634|nr:phosphotransferase [Brachybacterium nesterenkovii]
MRRGLHEELADVVAARLLTRDQASAVRRAIDSIPPFTGSPRCLHGDLKDVHFHTRDGELVALLDWGDATSGDPLYDLARYSLEGSDAFREFMAGYGPIDSTREALRGYRLRFTVQCLATELRAGGDWFSTYQQRIAADL